MRNKFDKFLLTLLWLSIALLGTCFWFNIKFGFNIFSKANWNYLAYMQASQQPINTTFYISLAVCIFISIFGLYLLLRPRYRKIKLAKSTTTNTSPTTNEQLTNPYSYAPVQERPKRLNVQHIPLPTTLTQSGAQPDAPVALPVPQTTPTAPAPTSAPVASESKWNKAEITAIFESAKYIIKNTPKISGLQTILFAIGTDETVWIGAADCAPEQLSKRIDVVQQVFADTLEDIEIKINGFVLNSTLPESTSGILVFDNTEHLREYVNKHPNTPPSADEEENFEAFSSYITTVIEYLGRI